MFERFVVVGCGRSGTRYASEMFTAMGLKCAHQKVFGSASELMGVKLPCNCGKAKGLRTDHESECRATYVDYGIDWKGHVGASSAFAAPVLDKVSSKTLVIHQVRNPWRVALSLAAAKHLPGMGKTNVYSRHIDGWDAYDDLHKRAAYVWWQWNLLIERDGRANRANYFFHRLEDYSAEKLSLILGLLGKEFTTEMEQAFKKIKTDVGSVFPRGPMPSFEGMPHGFWGMVSRYGYERPA